MLRARFRTLVPTLVGIVLFSVPRPGQAATAEGPEPPAKSAPVTTLTVSPMPEADPALRYRFLPLDPLRTPGNAAPVYLRLAHERNDQYRTRLHEAPPKLLDMSMESMPVPEARKLLGEFKGVLEMLDIAARRESCDWGYPLREQSAHIFGILLPDVQESRGYVRLNALRVRTAIAEGKYDEAQTAIRTGLSFARQIGDGPFLINTLVGIAHCRQVLSRVEEWVVRPQAPNIYWALTSLPSPLIDIRKGQEMEQALLDIAIPQLRELESPRSEAEWDVTLETVLARLEALRSEIPSEDLAKLEPLGPKTPRTEFHAKARRYLVAQGAAEAEVEAMRPSQAILAAISLQYRKNLGEVFKGVGLPYPQARPYHLKSKAARESSRGEEIAPILNVFLAQIDVAHLAQARLERHVAVLRTIEAIRAQAAHDGGKLPTSLDRITIVPVPSDPATGRPFGLEADGDGLMISSPDPEKPHLDVRIKLQLRK